MVVVGGGPGGLKCAETLGEAGKKVLILEKNEIIGPKVCAGGLTRKAFDFLGRPEEIIEKNLITLFLIHQNKKQDYVSVKILFILQIGQAWGNGS